MSHVLFVGGYPVALEGLDPAQLTVETVADVPAALARLREDPAIDLVVGDLDRLREAIDPLGLGEGPALAAPGDARHLALELELARARALVRATERALGTQARQHALAVEAADAEMLRRLGAAAAYSDDNTEEHNERVAMLAARLAAALGEPAETVARMRMAAPLHDIGKIAVPETILLKPGRLTSEEFAVVRTHAPIGARILTGSASPVVQLAATIVRSHHERWDGGGYPDGLAGDAIPLAGRIVAVADVYDILTHERPYKEKWTPDQAREELRRAAGTQLDPGVVAAFDALT